MAAELSSVTLPEALQTQLGFTPDSTQNWLVSNLINDRRFQVGSSETYEILPALARVLTDGTRFEVGARKIDLEGLLELAKILQPKAKGVDHLVAFWQGNPKIAVVEEDEWVFMGADIKPTPRGLEEEYHCVNLAYDLAITAAIEGKTYVQMLRNRWYKGWIRDIEKTHHGGYTELFPVLAIENQVAYDTCDIEPQVKADTLKDFPIGLAHFNVHNAPGSIKTQQQQREFINGSWMVIQPGYPGLLDGSRTVQISIPRTYKRFTKVGEKEPEDGLSLYLQIPDGVDVNTIEDIGKLKKVKVFTKVKNKAGDASEKMDVDILIEDNSLRVVSTDHNFELELRTPACPECNTPSWKFPDRHDLIAEHRKEDPEHWNENAFLYGSGEGGGLPPQFYVSFRDDMRSYCGNCIIPIVERYKSEHQYASRAKATEFVRQKLDELGYEQVKIGEAWLSGTGAEDIWDIYTMIGYQRGGRRISRYTGSPSLSHDGDFKSSMFPRKYVDFRYKAD